MLNRCSFRFLSAFALTSVIASIGLAQDKKPADKKDDKPAAAKPADKPADKGAKPAEPSPADKAMMEEMEKAAAPGENHKLLEKMAGNWDCTVKMWMGPGEPDVSKGTSKGKLILGGRFVMDEYEGTFMGKPFAGHGLTGYDNQKGKFVGSWADTAGTGIMNSVGTYDAASKSFTFIAEMTDPTAPDKTVKMKEVIKLVDDNTHVFEMWEDQDGKPAKVMEITYSRKK